MKINKIEKNQKEKSQKVILSENYINVFFNIIDNHF